MFCIFLTGNARNTLAIQNTPEGDVKMFYTALLFSLLGIARNANGIQNTPEGDVKMHYTFLHFL
jgi:hypothetical protein